MKTLYLASALLISGGHGAFASLIPLGAVPMSGTGLGAVFTALTFTSPANSTTETGCVAATSGGGTITGASACPAGFAGGDEQAINNSFSVAALGVTDFNNFQIIFNASEPGNAADMGITLDSLAVTLWNPADGLILDAKYTTAPYVIADAFPGTGNSGFGFALDAAQANDFNLLLATFPDLHIGIAANASDATGGHETIFLRITDAGTVVPEPSTYLLMSTALTAVLFYRRKRS